MFAEILLYCWGNAILSNTSSILCILIMRFVFPVALLLLSCFAQAMVLQQPAEFPDKLTALNQSIEALLKSKNQADAQQVTTEVQQALAEMTASEQETLLFSLGKMQLFNGLYLELIESQQALLKLIASDDLDRKAKALYRIGSAQARLGKFDHALATLLDVATLYQQQGKGAPLRALKGLGAINHNIGDYDKALGFFQQALEQSKPGSKEYLSLLMNVGATQLELGDLDAALSSLTSARQLSDELAYNRGRVYNNLGYLYVVRKEFSLAIEMLTVAMNSFALEKNPRELAVAEKSIGQAYLGRKDYAQAKHYLMSAYGHFDAKGFARQRLELYPVLTEALEKNRDYQQALKIFKEYKQRNDQTNSLAAKKHLLELQSEYDLKIEQQQVAQLKKQQALQSEVVVNLAQANQFAQQLNWLMAVLLAIVTVALVSGVVVVRSLRTKNHHIEKLNRRLENMSFYDELTQLPNRNYLAEFLSLELPNLQRQAAEGLAKKWMLLLLDIDRFKIINDTHGHKVGDIALRHFSECLRETGRDSDVLCRWGGEEFVWLCRDTEFDDVADLFARLQQTLHEKPLTINGDEIYLACSIGASELLAGASLTRPWDASFAIADEQLYAAKNAGRNCWRGLKIVDFPKGMDFTNMESFKQQVSYQIIQ